VARPPKTPFSPREQGAAKGSAFGQKNDLSSPMRAAPRGYTLPPF